MSKTMKRMLSKKFHSWWWDSHISPKNSTWLAKSLEEMDRLVKEMLKLIEEEGDSFAKKAEMYYKRRPELVTRVENFYRMYRALAERYDQVTGELRRSIQPGLQSEGSTGGSDFGSEASSPSQSFPPEQVSHHTLSHSKSKARAAGFDFPLGSGGISDSRKDSDTSESESESDGDDAKEMSGAMGPAHLCPGIVQLENELTNMEEKLQQCEQKFGDSFRCGETEDKMGLPSRVTELEAELTATNEKLQDSEKVIKQLRQELEKSLQVGAELSLLRKERSELETPATTLEATMSNYRFEIEQLNAAHSATLEQLRTDILDRDKAIQANEVEIATLRERSSDENVSLDVNEIEASMERFSQEKMLLEAKIGDQVRVIEELKDMIANSSKFSEEKLKLKKDRLSLSESHSSLEKKLALLEGERRQLEMEKTEVCASLTKRVEELRQNLDAFKLQVDMLSSEKAEIGAKVSALIDDVKRRDDRIHEMDVHLQKLHLEHVRVITETENARKAKRLMHERVKNLEEEVERLTAMISDGSEKKREAIRQLCFSLEHYRDKYNQLKQALLDHRRLPALLAS